MCEQEPSRGGRKISFNQFCNFFSPIGVHKSLLKGVLPGCNVRKGFWYRKPLNEITKWNQEENIAGSQFSASFRQPQNHYNCILLVFVFNYINFNLTRVTLTKVVRQLMCRHFYQMRSLLKTKPINIFIKIQLKRKVHLLKRFFFISNLNL